MTIQPFCAERVKSPRAPACIRNTGLQTVLVSTYMSYSTCSLVPRPRFPTAADGLHHRYVEMGLVHRSNFLVLWILDFGEPMKLQLVVTSQSLSVIVRNRV